MARALPVEPDVSPELSDAGDAMLLMISGSMWHTLVLQGQAEGVPPGEVLHRAVRSYLEARGSKEAVEYLWSLKRNQLR
jgi:hypothetical protein